MATNAAYDPNKNTIEETKRPITVLGVVVPGEKTWMVAAGLFAVLVFLSMVVLLLLPSGLPYLAAKFSDGFLSYLVLFFAYMFGFFFIMLIFFSLIALVGLNANRLYG